MTDMRRPETVPGGLPWSVCPLGGQNDDQAMPGGHFGSGSSSIGALGGRNERRRGKVRPFAGHGKGARIAGASPGSQAVSASSFVGESVAW